MDQTAGFFCFQHSEDFILSLVFCQDNDLDVTDFESLGFHYIIAFDFDDFETLLTFCQESNFSFIYYRIW